MQGKDGSVEEGIVCGNLQVVVIWVVFKEAGSEEAQGMCKNGRRGVWTRWAEGVGVLEGFNAGELGEDGVAKVGVPLKAVLVLEG